MTREDIKIIIDIVHKTIYGFFDVCGDDEETPMTDKDKLLLKVNKAICNNIKTLEQEPKTGHWIEIAQYSDGKHKIECSECKSHIFDRGHANSFNVKNRYKYCPNCGCRMFEPQESEE